MNEIAERVCSRSSRSSLFGVHEQRAQANSARALMMRPANRCELFEMPHPDYRGQTVVPCRPSERAKLREAVARSSAMISFSPPLPPAIRCVPSNHCSRGPWRSPRLQNAAGAADRARARAMVVFLSLAVLSSSTTCLKARSGFPGHPSTRRKRSGVVPACRSRRTVVRYARRL